MNYQIKFGTDGWRALIAKDYTIENVIRVATATAEWVNKQDNKKVVIGHDCRFGGRMFLETTAAVLAEAGIAVVFHDGIASTPMVSLATEKLNAFAGVVITASHNPPAYSGFKLKSHFGGPSLPDQISEVESYIPDQAVATVKSFDQYVAEGKITSFDFLDLYITQVQNTFNLEAISKLELAYDGMYGAGQVVMRNLFPDATFLHCEDNPGFDGVAPEPIPKNLGELEELIKISGDIDSGLATDGDADRIGLYDENGNFVDSHHLICILIHYLVKYKNLNGKVVNSFSCTGKINKMCEHYGLEQQITKIGFKYICDIMVQEDVLLGGEESGGIAVKGHVPERDGIWIALVIWEFMATTGKKLTELVEEVYEIVGPFSMQRYDLHLPQAQKETIVTACKDGKYDQQLAKYAVSLTETTDGFKYHINEDSWVMIRPSGTEPLLRVYAQAPNTDAAIQILNDVQDFLLS